MTTLANLTEVLFRLDFDPGTELYRYRGQTLSRRQCRSAILSQASQLARVLEPGDRVVLALNDSPSLVCLFLACIAVGAIPAVINPKTREPALAEILADCQASLVVREADAPSLSGPLAPLTLRATVGQPLLDDFSLAALAGPAEPGWSDFHRQESTTPCYLQYTSGSTGAPKGVIHTLRNTLGFCRAFAGELLALREGDRLYSIPKMFFGYGMGNSLFFPWFSGASALLDDTWPSAERVLENLRASRPKVLFGVPAIYAALRPHAHELLESVRLAFSAGSPLPRGEFEFWSAQGLEICDGIGATEVGHVFLANRPGQAQADSTGLPLPGYECRLLDRDGETVEAAGQQGVLLVRGPGLSPGYWRASVEQQARFADGWYRTGDLFERDERGAYRHCGREDDLFKVNGRWVVPTQVEQAVCRHLPEVREAVLVPTSRRHDGLRPTLFVTLDERQESNQILLAQRIDQHLGQRIPSHMLPSQLHVLPALPRNDNGKLARAELRHLADTLYHDNLPEERAC
ncbi:MULTISPECIES: anthranilate--CoA ligase [Pseudomonas aeruginosa group]|uniref:CoA ligase n=4 Tax=Pseudomonas aeruginosa group TaxID=136841 RepID=A0ABD7K8K6_PSEAI|nr:MULTISPECIES: anthranilate--CoA ligase [Pseudomonas aeruginosa group]VTS64922.1 fatty-acid CoA ligase [Streptococcus dysgalactiae subsp. equisimilis]ABR82847.1 putative coenzyme A ligase [Pseudomonas aeruginosa PA7]AVR69123.1 CoA ligase [Pseudomonas paraeruginosa]KAB0743334.1 AMP-binding protein [Pseudomonas aeruginosa]KPD27614.1 CoA ligase [Pseudomonas paraeruginosa]